MGYRIKKSGVAGFKVLFESHVPTRHARGVPRSEWPNIGFRDDMSMEEAKARASQLNSEDKLKNTEAKRNRINGKLSEERLRQAVHLPLDARAEFEKTKLKWEKPKTQSYWNCACRILAEVALPPKDWADSKEAFYRAFIKRGMSGTYIRAVLPMMNEWGMFLSRKYGTFFLPVPYPRGGWLKDIKEAFRKKPNKVGNRKSAPLTPEGLEAKAPKLSEEHYRWLKRTVWLGLRPIEADLLSQPSAPDTWWTETTQDITVLWVFQTKLYGQDADERTKYIPCFLPEQQKVVDEIGLLAKRPLQKKMREVFGKPITLYGGRKGFTELMKKHGQDFQDVSAWMGHADVTRTYNSYFNRKSVSFKKIA